MKRVPPPPIANEDSQLFRTVVGAVRPLAASTPPLARARPLPKRRRGEVDDARSRWSDLPFNPTLPAVAEQLSYLRTGCATKLLRQLRRGHYPVQGELDLHQLTAAAAHANLAAFLTGVREFLEGGDAQRPVVISARISFWVNCGSERRFSEGGPSTGPFRPMLT